MDPRWTVHGPTCLRFSTFDLIYVYICVAHDVHDRGFGAVAKRGKFEHHQVGWKCTFHEEADRWRLQELILCLSRGMQHAHRARNHVVGVAKPFGAHMWAHTHI